MNTLLPKLRQLLAIFPIKRLQMNPSFAWAIAIAALVAIWILSGELFNDDPKNRSATLETEQERIVAIRATTSFAQSHVNKIIIRGRTEALRTVTIKAETSGTVIAVPADEGNRVSLGDVICQLSINARHEQKTEAEATVHQYLLQYEAARQLRQKGHRSETEEAGALAAYDASLTALKQIELDIERTEIRAPFDGILDDREVEVGDYMRVGDSCATLFDEQPFLAVGYVPEADVSQLNIGAQGSAELVTGEVIEGKVRFISKRANETTRTFRVELEVPNSDRTLRVGVTAEIKIPLEPVRAHKVSPAVLVLNDQGQIGVRAVDENEIVYFLPVNIIDDQADGVWLSGLPNRLTIITVGQEYVSRGQKVTVHYEEAETQS